MDSYDALAGQVDEALRRGDLDLAARIAQRLIDHSPGEDLGYYRMAEIRLAQRKYTEAECYVGEALERNPHDAANFALLGDIREGAYGPAAAEEALMTAVGLEPEDPGHRIRLGMLRVQLGRAADGLPDLKTALDLGADEHRLRLMLELLESFGLPAPLRPLYRTVSYLLARPDLSEPGAAGTDPELLAEQAAVARRLAVPLGQDEPTTRAAWRLSRELAEAVLAGEPGNATAREALKTIALNESRTFGLYSDQERTTAYVAAVRELAARLEHACEALEKERTAERMRAVFTVAGDLLRVIEEAGDWDSPTAQQTIRAVTEVVARARADWRPGAGEAESAAEALAGAGLAETFADFYQWLAAGAPGPEA